MLCNTYYVVYNGQDEVMDSFDLLDDAIDYAKGSDNGVADKTYVRAIDVCTDDWGATVEDDSEDNRRIVWSWDQEQVEEPIIEEELDDTEIDLSDALNLDFDEEELTEANNVVRNGGYTIEDNSKGKCQDNAVVDCPVHDIIAHCEDDKPIDCKMKKPALEKPVAGDPVNVKVNQGLTEAKKEEDELPPDPEAVKLDVHNNLNNLVASEISTIDEYENAKSEIIDAPIEHKDELISTIDHIKDEEKEHIDELINATSEIPFAKTVSDTPIAEPTVEKDLNETVETESKEDFIKNLAKDDYEKYDGGFAEDEFDEFKALGKKAGYDFTEEDFNFYFECVGECQDDEFGWDDEDELTEYLVNGLKEAKKVNEDLTPEETEVINKIDQKIAELDSTEEVTESLSSDEIRVIDEIDAKLAELEQDAETIDEGFLDEVGTTQGIDGYKVNNVPPYADNYNYIVARYDAKSDSLWFWGAFDNEAKAKDVAEEIGGQVIYRHGYNIDHQNESLTESPAEDRLEEIKLIAKQRPLTDDEIKEFAELIRIKNS